MDASAMQRRYPEWMVFDISEFLQSVRPLSISLLNNLYAHNPQVNGQNFATLINLQHHHQIEKLVSHLLEEKFLTRVVNYNRSSEEPLVFKDALQHHIPNYEALFHKCLYSFKSMIDLPAQIRVQITTRDLYIQCL